MKKLLALVFFLLIVIPSASAQETKNPSLRMDTINLPYYEFNRVARDAVITELDNVHAVSWRVTIDNNLLYANPAGNAVLRIYDDADPEKFIEVGMGSPPNNKFWTAVQIPEKEGYIVIHRTLERGWLPQSLVVLSYSDRDGLTVNNGERIVVSKVNIGSFAIKSYSVFGMEGSTDPPATNSGEMTVEVLSGDPAKNIYAMFPFVVTAAVGALVGALYLTKRRSS